MPKRPKRDLRKKWNRDEEDAMRLDESIRRGTADPDRDRRYILDNAKLWKALARHGLTKLGPTRLKELGIELIQMKRLEPAPTPRMKEPLPDAPWWVPREFEMVERPKPAKTISAFFIDRLLSAIDDADRRAEAARDIEEAVIDDREAALFRHGRAWRDRTAGFNRPVEARVPRFHERDGALVFEPLESPERIVRKEAEFRALVRRINRVMGGRSQTTVGPFDRLLLMRWRNISALLCWEESGFSERHWSELTDDELRRFVEAGDIREQILARRDDDFSRVRAALRDRRPPPRGPEPPPAGPTEEPWDGFEISADEIRELAVAEQATKRGSAKAPARKAKADNPKGRKS